MDLGDQFKYLFGINELNKYKTEDEIIYFLINEYCSYNRNKKTHPNTLFFLKKKLKIKNIKFKIIFDKELMIINNKEHILGKQLLFEYYICKYLKNNIKCNELKNHLCKKNKNKCWIFDINSIIIEHPYKTFENKNRRCDMVIILPNNKQLVIEINEDHHKDRRHYDLCRLYDIKRNNNEIKQIYYLTIKNSKEEIKKFVIEELIPDLIFLNDLYDQKKFIVNELKKINNDDTKEWIDILECIYDAHNDKKNPIISIKRLNKYFEIDLTKKLIKRQEDLYNEEIKYNNLEIKDRSNDIDSESDDESDSNDEIFNDDVKINQKEEIIYHVEQIFDEDKKYLTWNGLLLYFTTCIKYNNNIKKELALEKFNNGIYTKLIDVYKEKYNQLINKSNNDIRGI